MRPTYGLFLTFFLIALFSILLCSEIRVKRKDQARVLDNMATIVSNLGLSDLAISTEARYTRHPVASDTVVISMDHPGALDHFPSTAFWTPL